MFFSKKIKFFISLCLVILQINFCFAEFLTIQQEEVTLNQALSPNSQLTSIDGIFAIALRMANSGMSENEIWDFLKAAQTNVIGVSLNSDILSIEITNTKDDTILYEFKIDRNISQPDKIYESVLASLNKPLEVIAGAADIIQSSFSSIVKVLVNSWKTLFIASLLSIMIVFMSPYNSAEAAAKPATVVTAEQQVKELAAQLKIDAERNIDTSKIKERKKLDESYYKYIFETFKEASYALYYKIDPHSKDYGHSSAFKASARNYAEEKAQENIDDVIKGLNWTIFEESKKFTMISKVAKNYGIDPTLLMTIRVFETWDLSYGEKYTDFFKAALTDETSIGAYQIRIDKMDEYLKSSYNDIDFMKANPAFFKKYPTYKNFTDVHGSIKSVLEADGEATVELAIIFLKKHTEALKEAFPDIFEKSFSLKDSAIKDSASKNKFNVFFLAYTYDLIGNHKGESMMEIFQRIKTNKPDLYLWMKIESKTLELLQGIIGLYHGDRFSDISEIKGFNLNDFTKGISKDSVPSGLMQKTIIKYSLWGALLVALAGIIYTVRKFYTGNKSSNRKNQNRKTVNMERIVSSVVEQFQSKTNKLIQGNPRTFRVMYGDKLFPLKLTVLEKSVDLESFFREFNKNRRNIVLEIARRNTNAIPQLSELYIPVHYLNNKYANRSNIIYDLYNMQLEYLKNGVLVFEHKPGMINLAYISLIAGILNKNLNLTVLGKREIGLLHQAA